MKKWIMILVVLVFLFTTGCSALNKVNDTLNYVNEASEYVGEASNFANEIPALIEQAINDQNAREDLEQSLNDMKTNIEEFTQLNPPEIVGDLHQQIEDQSKTVEEFIDVYLQNIEDGKLDPSLLENSNVLDTINEMTNALDALEKLGQ